MHTRFILHKYIKAIPMSERDLYATCYCPYEIYYPARCSELRCKYTENIRSNSET